MKNIFFFITFTFLTLYSCQNDDSVINNNQVAFTSFTVPVSDNPVTLNIAFTNPTSAAGFLTLSVTNSNVEYDIDYTTNPQVSENEIIVPFEGGVSNVSFAFTPLVSAIEGQQKNVKIKITNVSIGAVAIPENTSSVDLNFGEAPVTQNTLSALLGGANLPNQVYIDLSSGMQTGILRTNWDLAFYSGDGFRVKLNGANAMAVKQINSTDLEQNVTIDSGVAVGSQNGSVIENGDVSYVDHPDGSINSTIISVAENENDNKVYLVNLGFGLSGETPANGEIAPLGESRGWMKVRILRDAQGYKLQYAEPSSPTYTEVLIAKQNTHNFTFFSFNSNAVVNVEPQIEKWDLNLTTFTDYVDFGNGNVSYLIPDFAAINNLGGTRAYQVIENASLTYDNFSAINVEALQFASPQASKQTIIGSSWRVAEPFGAATVKSDRFYVIRDEASNVYKLRFISLANDSGQRGTIKFEYELVL